MQNIRALLAVAALALAGCGASPSSALDFKAPQGWGKSPSMLGTQLWMRVANDRVHMVMLIHVPSSKANTGSADLVKEFAHNPSYHNVVAGPVQAQTICGNHAAAYEASTATDFTNRRLVTESIATTWGSDGYVATYTRSSNEKADPAGEAAIRSLCKKT